MYIFNFNPRNANTAVTSGEQAFSFLDIAELCHLLSTDSYLDLVVGLHNSRITSVISGGMFGCLRDLLINKLPAVSISGVTLNKFTILWKTNRAYLNLHSVFSLSR